MKALLSWWPSGRRILTCFTCAIVQQLKEFDGNKLKSCTKEGLDIDADDEKTKLQECKAEFEPLTKVMKEVLGDKTDKVIVSARLSD